jgi:hypothetical protein
LQDEVPWKWFIGRGYGEKPVEQRRPSICAGRLSVTGGRQSRHATRFYGGDGVYGECEDGVNGDVVVVCDANISGLVFGWIQ